MANQRIATAEIIAERKARFPKIAQAIGSTGKSLWAMEKDVAKALGVSTPFIAGVVTGRWPLPPKREEILRDKTRRSSRRLPKMDVFRTQGLSSSAPKRGKKKPARLQIPKVIPGTHIIPTTGGKKRRRGSKKSVQRALADAGLLSESALSAVRKLRYFPTRITKKNGSLGSVQLLTSAGVCELPFSFNGVRMVRITVDSLGILVPLPASLAPVDPKLSTDADGKYIFTVRFEEKKS